jgi:transcriptional regulator with AAA-type ATPase domain
MFQFLYLVKQEQARANSRTDSEQSGRKGLLVKMNCASIPADLVEGELFGYQKGLSWS